MTQYANFIVHTKFNWTRSVTLVRLRSNKLKIIWMHLTMQSLRRMQHHSSMVHSLVSPCNNQVDWNLRSTVAPTWKFRIGQNNILSLREILFCLVYKLLKKDIKFSFPVPCDKTVTHNSMVISLSNVSVIYLCKLAFYQATGSSHLNCSEDGFWNGSVPICLRQYPFYLKSRSSKFFSFCKWN